MKRKTRIVLVASSLALSLLLFTGFKREDPTFFEIAKQLEIFTELFKELNMNYVDEPSPTDLMNTAIKSMLKDLDPYTTYLSEEEVESFRINNAGSYSGLGATVRTLDDKVVILETYKGYSADEAGLKAGDEIFEVDGILVNEAGGNVTQLIKGARNTSVEVKYRRAGKEYKASIVRKGVSIDAVPYYGMVGDHTGYVVLSRFNQKATTQVKSAINDLQNQGATQFVLDLRGNPGGLLSEAIDLVNLFIPKNELVVYTQSRVKKFNNQYRTKNDPLVPDVPLAVLINERSASASEIVSGGLQDKDRAVIVGTRSFGKGLVQRPINLVYGTNLKVTISRYYTSSGRCIQALDYSQRDEDGKAIRNTQFNEFKTKNGRTVTDGGGITPDIAVDRPKVHPLVKEMENELLLFDFCTDYINSGKPLPAAENPRSVDERLWEAFLAYVPGTGFSMETESERLVRSAMSKDSLFMNAGLRQEYDRLIRAMDKNEQAVLESSKDYILKEIREELLLRQLYREGLYPVLLPTDPDVARAVEIMDNERRYSSILKR